ncbi:histidine-type phosphatase [Treponema sp. HNW]|uniref:histidine-type phosphatase n=1 Tax=Treponema sp. HNW TaxID=3116654 RepID=UPI003D147702
MGNVQRLKMKKNVCVAFLVLLSVSLFALNNYGGIEAKKDYPMYNMYLGSKIPYPGPGKAALTSIPAGYKVNFIYWVNRHGSRNLSSFKYDKAWSDMLVFAESKGQLTEKGKILLKEIQKVITHEQNRYGLLTSLGKDELYGIGNRTGVLYKDLFSSNRPLLAKATYKERTWESRENFLKGLEKTGYKGEITLTHSKKNTDPYLRPFDMAAKYKKYKKAGKWHEKIDAFSRTNDAEIIAKKVIAPFFKPEFLTKIDKGEFEFKSEKDDTVIKDIVTAAYSLWEIYSVLPAMKTDGLTDVDMSTYFTKADLQFFEDYQNAQSFYSKGPGSAGKDSIALSIMAPLAKNMINEVDKYLKGESSYLGVFDFCHAETVVPLVGFFEIGRSAVSSEDISKALKYWDAGYYGPMAANVEWIIYTAEDKEPLVKMLLNEREVSFSASIKPVNTFYYRWSDVKTYYSEKAAKLGFGLDTTLEENIETLKSTY